MFVLVLHNNLEINVIDIQCVFWAVLIPCSEGFLRVDMGCKVNVKTKGFECVRMVKTNLIMILCNLLSSSKLGSPV